MTSSRRTIDEILARKRLAFVGFSRDPKHISQALFREFDGRGYEVVPVNPNAPEIAGQRCYASVADVQPPPEAAIIFTQPARTDDAVRDCAAAGVRYVWMYRAGGAGSVSPKAVEFCREKGIEVVPGECPFMFLPHTQLVHRFHGGLKKILGSYPK